jgi:hypothetical protein
VLEPTTRGHTPDLRGGIGVVPCDSFLVRLADPLGFLPADADKVTEDLTVRIERDPDPIARLLAVLNTPLERRLRLNPKNRERLLPDCLLPRLISPFVLAP